ncbi:MULTISPECIES: phage tail protein [Nocardioides]|uniref:Uncharacterized protein n=1 Tax=Nocardioides vastitatis TaxID=2568655 RepID=A0ABW0ZM37_9ACTN|nr:hypothetical protein [Nocardioides sp.]THI97394.1 hypothetical protein E7Z54_14675 [Nocardioides sp.]
MSVARESARAPEPDGGARHSLGTVQPRGRPAEMLALQRAAGNRAVAAAVRSRQAPVRRAPVTSPSSAERPPLMSAPSAPSTAAGEPVVQGDFLDDVVGGLAEVGGGVRDRALGWIRDRARSLPGYGLLCVVLGKDVITDAPVQRTGAALIDGFLGLIPGSDRIRQNLQESGATEKAGQWLDEEVPKLGLTFDAVKALFRRAWDALDVTDLVDPAGAWAKLVDIFADPVRRLRDFAVGAARKLMEFVFEGALSLAGGAGQAVMGIIRRAGGVFDQIIANPIGFAGNLVAAVRGGLGQFLANVGAHLRNGLIGWLTGALGGVIRIPERFDLRGILGMAMDLLGLTWDRVRGRLVRLVGDRVVGALERGAGIISDLAQRGLAAITDRISQFTEGLLDTVLGGIREWVTQSVVGAAITRLISMFNPAGAVIQAVIAIYNTVQFFIERAQQLASLASAVFDSIAAIASGNLSSAITWVEQALSRAVPAVLGFLSRLIGIGDIATPVRNVMQRVHGVIDQALDRVINWIAGLARRAAGALGRGAGRVREGAREVGERLGIIRKPVRAPGESHTISVDPDTRQIRMASTEGPIKDVIRARYTALQGRWRAEGRTVPDVEQFVSAVMAQIDRAQATINNSRQNASATANAQLDRLVPLVTDLLIRIGSTETRTGADRPTGIGNVAPHRSQPSRNTGDHPDRHLESEHVIPVRVVSTLLEQLGETEIIERGGPEDTRQHTVMVYKGAATSKTRGTESGDSNLIRQLKSIAATGAPAIEGSNITARRVRGSGRLAEVRQSFAAKSARLMAVLVERLPAIAAARIDYTARKVTDDHQPSKHAGRGHTEVLPSADRIRTAAALQAQDIATIVSSRLRQQP